MNTRLGKCIHVWGNTHAVHLSRLTVLQKRAIRIIAGVPSRSHTDTLFHEYKLIKFDDIIVLNIGLFMHKFYHGLLPDTFALWYRCNSQFHSYSTRGHPITMWIRFWPFMTPSSFCCFQSFWGSLATICDTTSSHKKCESHNKDLLFLLSFHETCFHANSVICNVN